MQSAGNISLREVSKWFGVAIGCGVLLIGGCKESQSVAATGTIPPFKTKASIQELMQSLVDPSADAVWDSVGVSATPKGNEQHQPHTEEEWQRVRLHALALIESTNLLMMEGRRLVPLGARIADDGADGVLSTEEGEHLLQSERATFVQFARALNDVGLQMLNAIDAKQPKEMLQIGEAMDEVCESCHTKFWYPRQATWVMSQGDRTSPSHSSAASAELR